MVTRPASSATVLETRPGRSPRIETDAAADTGTGMEIQFRSPRFDLRRSRSWLALACRFAPVAVSVDGADLTQGFQDALFSVSLGRPLPGGLAITADGDVPHLWLLRHGVLATRAAIPGYPPFEASLELGGVTPEAATPDELRGTVNPHLPALVDRAMALVVDAVCEGPYVDPSRLTRLATIVLRSAHKGLQLDRIVGLEVFQSVNLARGARTQRSLEQLQGLADEDGAVLWSVPPETDLGRLPSDDRDVLVLTPEQHGLLADLVSCPVQRPEPKPRFVLGALASAAADSWRALKRRFSPDRAGRQLKDTEMLAAEQALLCVLEGVTSVADGEVLEPRLCAGLGRARRSGGLLLLHRNNPLVVEAVRVVETDDAWRYPALLAAVGEEAVLPPELRVRWRRSLLADGRK
jgi:hypothetical protein